MGEETILNIEQNLALLKDLLSCGETVWFWCYGTDGHLAETNCSHLVLNTFFERSSLSSLLGHFEKQTEPLILSSQLGLMWAATKDRNKGVLYVIGPVLNSEMSTADIADAALLFEVDLSWREDFIHLLESIPTISTILFYQYAIMLHFCVTGEKLSRSALSFQVSEPLPKKGKASSKTRQHVYKAERTLLACVRNGDLNYQTALARAGGISAGIRIKTKNPIDQAVISTTSFTTLVVRAAIEGGLSPEVAYTVGDSYIQSMVGRKTISDLSALNHQMIDDFVHRVHACHESNAQSKMVRDACGYIEIHLEDPLTLAILAQAIGYSESHLSRSFKSEMGLGVSQYIRTARIEKAKTLLETSDISVAEIATLLHFASSSHFSGHFREQVGLLPQEYRKKHKV